MATPFKFEQHQDRQVNQIQRNIEQATAPARANLLNEGTVIGPIVFQSNVQQDLAHGLGKAWTGWLIIDIDRNGTVERPTQTDPTKYLTVKFLASCTAKFLVF